MIASGHMEGKTPIICVIGPTASGKSARAIALAKEKNGEVISVDSRQVYRMLDIGTEKISKEEMGGIPHHLIDIRDPKDPYSAGDFAADATRLIEDMTARGKTPILAGGSHFYFDALVNGIPLETPMDSSLREKLEKLSDEELFEQIKEKDLRRSLELDPRNRRRLIRALEIIHQHGAVPPRNPARLNLAGLRGGTLLNIEWVVMRHERETLRARIEKRLQEALDKGLVEEVRRVHEYVGDTRLNELGLEYRIVGEFLRGERTESTVLPALTSKLFQYARRQEAWIRKLLNKRK